MRDHPVRAIGIAVGIFTLLGVLFTTIAWLTGLARAADVVDVSTRVTKLEILQPETARELGTLRLHLDSRFNAFDTRFDSLQQQLNQWAMTGRLPVVRLPSHQKEQQQ